MFLRVFTLRFNTVLDGFDDGEVRDFMKDKEVLSIREHFFLRNDVPYLTVVITYNLAQDEDTSFTPSSRSRRDESWRDLITEAELPLFNTLRDWRTERAKREGVPVYIICNNKQLAAIVKVRPQNLSALAQINGFGKTKVERYGREILAILSRSEKSQKALDTQTQKAEEEDPDAKR